MENLIASLANEYPNNFVSENIENGICGVNPNAFKRYHEIDDVANKDEAIRKIMKDLFEKNPSAKVFRVDFALQYSFDKACLPHVSGGTLTISGTF